MNRAKRILSLSRAGSRSTAALLTVLLFLTSADGQVLHVRTEFDSASHWVNAAPPGAALPNHAASITTDGTNSFWRWDVTADQPDSFLVGLPLAETNSALNALITPLDDTSAQARFHVDGGQPDGGLGVQVAIVSHFSLGSQDMPQGYCLLVGDGRLDLARFDFNGPGEPFEILSSVEGAEFLNAGGFDINPLQGELDVIMRLDVVDKSDGKVLDGWFWEASTAPDPAFFDTPMITADLDFAFPAGVVGLEARTNSTTEAMSVDFDWIEATGVVPEPSGSVLLLLGATLVLLKRRQRLASEQPPDLKTTMLDVVEPCGRCTDE